MIWLANIYMIGFALSFSVFFIMALGRSETDGFRAALYAIGLALTWPVNVLWVLVDMISRESGKF